MTEFIVVFVEEGGALVLEYMPGGTLADRLHHAATPPLPADTAAGAPPELAAAAGLFARLGKNRLVLFSRKP